MWKVRIAPQQARVEVSSTFSKVVGIPKGQGPLGRRRPDQTKIKKAAARLPFLFGGDGEEVGAKAQEGGFGLGEGEEFLQAGAGGGIAPLFV